MSNAACTIEPSSSLDEGHGFAKEENRLLYYKELAKFFDKHLKKG